MVHATANCLPEMRAEALLSPLLIFSILSSVKSGNIDFCMDFYLAQNNTLSVMGSISNVYALVTKHGTFTQITRISFVVLFIV